MQVPHVLKVPCQPGGDHLHPTMSVVDTLIGDEAVPLEMANARLQLGEERLEQAIEEGVQNNCLVVIEDMLVPTMLGAYYTSASERWN